MDCFARVADETFLREPLNVLHPQARKFFDPNEPWSVVYLELPKPISQELQKAVWQCPVDNWAMDKLGPILAGEGKDRFLRLRITDLRAFLFPTRIFIICLEMEPVEKGAQEQVIDLGKAVLSGFIRFGSIFADGSYASKKMERVFSDERGKEAVERSMGNEKNAGMRLCEGLCGAPVTLAEMIESLLPPNQWKFLMGDRFLVNALIRTGWDGNGSAFDSQELKELVRLSRGYSDLYLPDQRSCQPGTNGIIKTFENVAFAAAGEGLACWVKPAPRQTFLQDGFKDRFARIYFLLYLLALHQRYALVDLSLQVDDIAPSSATYQHLSENGEIREIEQAARKFQTLRNEVANFYLRAFFQQPAVLTVHQQFYDLLQSVFGVPQLLQEIQLAVPELDEAVGRVHRQKIERLEHQKRDNKFILAVIAEVVAIPYYSFSFLTHALHFPTGVGTACALFFTGLAVWATSRGFYRMKISPFWRNLCEKIKQA